MTATEAARHEFVGTDLTGARFHRVHLNGARFRMVDLTGAVLRDVSLEGASVDGEIAGLVVNGIEVEPLVEAELARRVPARAMLDASDPEQLRRAWASLQGSWAATCRRVEGMPAGTVDGSVEGEWSFAQTLRHLVFVTDGWLGAVRGDRERFHPWGLPFTDIAEFMDDPGTLGTDPTAAPAYDEVMAVRAERAQAVGDFLAQATPEILAEQCQGPAWAGEEPLAVLRCLRIILREECEHLRFAQRDLDLLDAS